jgi:hypothetical protein
MKKIKKNEKYFTQGIAHMLNVLYICSINNNKTYNTMKNITIFGDNVASYETLAIRAARMWKKRGYKVSEIEISDVNGCLTFGLYNNGSIDSLISLNGERLKFEW